jgi:hypothetical protein
VLFQLCHRGIKSALPDRHLHLGERGVTKQPNAACETSTSNAIS